MHVPNLAQGLSSVRSMPDSAAAAMTALPMGAPGALSRPADRTSSLCAGPAFDDDDDDDDDDDG